MVSKEINPEATSAEEQAKAAELMAHLGKLALTRTGFSSERTLMSWIRTAVSLYTFGFTITKFVGYMEQKMESVPRLAGLNRLGIVLIGLGLVSLVIAVTEQVRRRRIMKELGLPLTSRVSLPVVAAGLLFAIGVLALTSIVLNWSL